MNKRHYEHTLPNIRGSLSNTYKGKRRIKKAAGPRQVGTQENLPDHHDRTGKRLNQRITVRLP